MKFYIATIYLLLIITSAFSQKLGRYTIEEWQTIIDTTWGIGLSTEKKLQIFDLYWNAVDAGYAGFNNLDVDWDALKNKYRPEVAEGVSRGRFAAIMNQMALALKEMHTHANDLVVRGDSLHPGTPLLAFHSVYQPFNNSHFGAGLTPLPDSSALVYTVVDNHPLGLERGDIILGYDGIPWKDLYKNFLQAELPITGPDYINVGTSDKSVSHMWLMSAGLNWHLCDTIDILKYGSSDTLHLPTDILRNQDMNLFCAEQLPVAGVPMIDLSGFRKIPMVSWGIVENTQIGYIYVSYWRDLEEPAFTEAVNTLLDDYQTTGLIIDFRANPGGNARMANGGFSRLFNFDLKVIEYAERSDPDDHLALVQVTSGSCCGQNFRFHADPYLYDKPIAVLTGPRTSSHADVNALRLKFHPMARVFGKATNSGFTCYFISFHNVIENNPDYPDWQAGYAPRNTYLISNPGQYLLHVGFDVDEEVWLTPDDVAKGEDTVVKRAIEWIQNLAYAHDVTVNKSYVKSDVDSVLITASVENPNQHELSVEGVIRNADSTVTDILAMFDDGMHGDGAANDNLWGNFYLPTGEQLFKISVTTNDLTEETTRTLPNVAWFITIGPLKFDHFEYISTDTIPNPGDQIRIRIFIRNNGSIATASNITAKLSSPDTSVTVNTVGYLRYGDIGADEINESSSGYLISFNGPFDKSIYQVPFTLDIRSNNFSYWVDTTLAIVVDIEQKEKPIPQDFSLSQNYPNPFNPTTMINYQLPITSHVEITIYNLIGQKVATLVNKKQTAGSYKVEWDASGFATGIYYYKLVAGDFQQARKMVLIK